MSGATQRNTKQREAIAELLRSHDVFFTAQEIHQRLQRAQVKIGLSTVYRLLSGMVAAGEIDSVVRSDGQTLYRACSEEHHHHLRCRACGKAVEITVAEIESFSKKLGKQHGFTKLQHIIEISGLCKMCSQSNN